MGISAGLGDRRIDSGRNEPRKQLVSGAKLRSVVAVQRERVQLRRLGERCCESGGGLRANGSEHPEQPDAEFTRSNADESVARLATERTRDAPKRGARASTERRAIAISRVKMPRRQRSEASRPAARTRGDGDGAVWSGRKYRELAATDRGEFRSSSRSGKWRMHAPHTRAKRTRSIRPTSTRRTQTSVRQVNERGQSLGYSQGMSQLQNNVNDAQLNAQMQQQQTFAQSQQAANALNAGVSQQNAANAWKQYQAAVGGLQGGMQGGSLANSGGGSGAPSMQQLQGMAGGIGGGGGGSGAAAGAWPAEHLTGGRFRRLLMPESKAKTSSRARRRSSPPTRRLVLRQRISRPTNEGRSIDFRRVLEIRAVMSAGSLRARLPSRVSFRRLQTKSRCMHLRRLSPLRLRNRCKRR